MFPVSFYLQYISTLTHNQIKIRQKLFNITRLQNNSVIHHVKMNVEMLSSHSSQMLSRSWVRLPLVNSENFFLSIWLESISTFIFTLSKSQFHLSFTRIYHLDICHGFDSRWGTRKIFFRVFDSRAFLHSFFWKEVISFKKLWGLLK